MTLLTTAVLSLALAQSKPEPVDLGALRDTLLVLTDGQKHYIAVDPAMPQRDDIFYSGDGKVFARVPHGSGGRSGTESWSNSFWDPRVMLTGGSPGSVWMQDSGAKYEVNCAKKTTTLHALPADEARKLLATATFTERVWTRRAEKLLRDDTGVYFFVDRFLSKDPLDRRDFRVFVGPKGAMKQLPLKNIVDDDQGMILATKGGNLRLITGPERKLEGKWVQGKTVTPLVEIDLDRYDSGHLVYMDLGPYSGLRLGTPCDDLM
jgi:hypothetical protein